MSIENPNEYEQAIEDYAAAVRHEQQTKKDHDRAVVSLERATQDRQAKWRKVSAFVNDRKIQPGIYRLNKGPGIYADGLLIETHHDYPDLFPMFR